LECFLDRSYHGAMLRHRLQYARWIAPSCHRHRDDRPIPSCGHAPTSMKQQVALKPKAEKSALVKRTDSCNPDANMAPLDVLTFIASETRQNRDAQYYRGASALPVTSGAPALSRCKEVNRNASFRNCAY